ncbi:SprT-like domain-containing protein [Mycoplasmopsis gallinarum]|uniref:YgjP-like metallopeptidase domain-containing protein n=1 Tax=Mycoplasmopsis gallinarum TaxID=29557 RepID=A0A168R912_9BACT|nr:SprT-like domain-containing protein [Mycoplasmopsis gallinarum]OAB48732.1 hypothetical protein MGALLINA_05210 [Mycoplasmopsis gallinarum]
MNNFAFDTISYLNFENEINLKIIFKQSINQSQVNYFYNDYDEIMEIWTPNIELVNISKLKNDLSTFMNNIDFKQINLFTKNRIFKKNNATDFYLIFLFGKSYQVLFFNSNINQVIIKDSQFMVYFSQKNRIKALIYNFFAFLLNDYIKEPFEKFHKLLQIPIPIPYSIKNKKTSYWGRYFIKEKRIEFSALLCSVSKHKIDKTIIHELIHYYYPKHNKDFTKMGENLIADFKKRTKDPNIETNFYVYLEEIIKKNHDN